MFTRFNARKIVVGLIAIVSVGGHLALVAGAAPLKIDFTQNNGPLQAGYQAFSHGTDGGGLVTKTLPSDLGLGGTVDVSISGNTHWRTYDPATGIFAAQSDLLRDGPLCNNTCTMTLGLDNLADGVYDITTYHHTTLFGPNGSPGVPARALDPFDIALTDGVVTGSIVAAGVEESDNGSPSLSTQTFQFTVSGGSPVEIDLRRPVNTASMHMTLAAVDIDAVIPEPSSIVLLLFGALSFLPLSRRRQRSRPPA
ncbi:MAG: PEP-CTERM sorting domain-containing protein [Planctomycetes bacterium]|nr:PEP-CTERM sorting domain-containing protein [Planctomycetota bacterium]